MKDDGGPNAFWVSADPPGLPRQYSDCVIKVGWHGATNHAVPNPVFQVVTQPSRKIIELGPGNHPIKVEIDGNVVYDATIKVVRV